MVPGIKTALFGGEGLFFVHLTGPGRVILQTLPFSRLADRIIAASPRAGRTSEGGGQCPRCLGGSHTVNNHKVTWGSSMSDVVTSSASHKAADTSRDNALSRRVITVALLVAVGYYLTAKIGFAFALQPGSVSTLWMPNSILLAGLLLVPKRSWWIVLVACSG